MRLPEAAPGEGGVVDFEYFTNWSIPGGEKHTAYIAGRAKWFICHPSDKGTKPCLHWMTKGALPCRFCHAHKTPVELGYLPLWRETDWRPKFAIVYDTEREHLAKLELHDRVCIGRETDSGARLWVRKMANQEPRFCSTLARRMVEQDLTRTLLTTWGLPELTVWLQQASASDNAVPLDKPAIVKSDGEGFGEMTKAAAQKYTPPDALDATSAFHTAGNRIKDRLSAKEAKPSKNGHHKPGGDSTE